MTDETIETVRTLLRGALENTDDTEVHYKLRTALQLLDVYKNDIDQLQEAAESDGDLEERLSDLGYLQ
ncbi:hypothetical protein D3D02_04070 [Halobellus sp. Atlit-38R]|uniref:hypothetical protein n=1 Tax=Halobellus sp. Atlit-38R TaxID=2282131 RepID=UPI000EF1E6F8|nr:hypothetical protein [Halobellus sp. Atlit-38R]RLM90942.1 hypothetical protein D3D02_04070 [Halobellus sp. Atlit-38R]